MIARASGNAPPNAPPARLPLRLAGATTHLRRGSARHRLTHRAEMVLIDPESPTPPPFPLRRNRFGLLSVSDRDHGGPPGRGRGAAWARQTLEARGVTADRLALLTTPRFLWWGFNPVSFWLAWRDEALVAVIAEVTNTWGQRHAYVCRHEDGRPITPDDRLTAAKIFHVSPFQDVAGDYAFRFDFDFGARALDIRIVHRNGPEGVAASLAGPLMPLGRRALAGMMLRHPFGPLRTLALIHWHALRLALKGARWRERPAPPASETSP
ncbi:DUF1365 domain-containing protein [Oceanicella actignis]|uniref:DUF1365 domain-containing protein n=1 Tax=Oceanicella actignis TaxID=1189325 RepID=UPI0011E6F6AE|nr:DUF1365 domain-containing protein [Oceanicella actignis]TYO90450.1 hypothetical protein LY05_00579 [Oceanicella actignis]